ncbi:Hypothetical predicted protein [Mytilus galloprovincialis]|uniref:Lysine--tRNA ligase n=1 Tax=Mytilus galloprovincialis TaxID=29158 RepID=A0A8B6BXV1_MYTGA|nr:Hypothetical predicted protein [Mytilus galloprovincialis]
MASCTFSLSKNELKRRMKAEKKAKEKAEKGPQNTPQVQESEKAVKPKDDEEIDANEYFKLRSKSIAQLKEKGQNPYPHKFHVQMSLSTFINTYDSTPIGETKEEEVTVAGRVHAKRLSSSKLIFYDLRAEGVKIQVMSNKKFFEPEDSFDEINDNIKRGDIIGVVGKPVCGTFICNSTRHDSLETADGKSARRTENIRLSIFKLDCLNTLVYRNSLIMSEEKDRDSPIHGGSGT